MAKVEDFLEHIINGSYKQDENFERSLIEKITNRTELGAVFNGYEDLSDNEKAQVWLTVMSSLISNETAIEKSFGSRDLLKTAATRITVGLAYCYRVLGQAALGLENSTFYNMIFAQGLEHQKERRKEILEKCNAYVTKQYQVPLEQLLHSIQPAVSTSQTEECAAPAETSNVTEETFSVIPEEVFAPTPTPEEEIEGEYDERDQQRLTNKINELNAEIHDLTDQVNTLEANRSTLDALIEKAQGNLNRTNEALKTNHEISAFLEKDYQQSTAKINTLKSNRQEHVEKGVTLQSEINNSLNRIGHATLQEEEIGTKISDLSTQFEKIKQDNNSRQGKLSIGEKRQAIKEIKEREQELETLKSERQDVINDKTSEENKETSLEASLQASQMEITTLDSQISIELNKSSQLTIELDEKSQEKARLETNKQRLEKNIERQQAQLKIDPEEKKAKLNALIRDRNKTQEELDRVNHLIEVDNAKFSALVSDHIDDADTYLKQLLANSNVTTETIDAFIDVIPESMFNQCSEAKIHQLAELAKILDAEEYQDLSALAKLNDPLPLLNMMRLLTETSFLDTDLETLVRLADHSQRADQRIDYHDICHILHKLSSTIFEAGNFAKELCTRSDYYELDQLLDYFTQHHTGNSTIGKNQLTRYWNALPRGFNADKFSQFQEAHNKSFGEMKDLIINQNKNLMTYMEKFTLGISNNATPSQFLTRSSELRLTSQSSGKLSHEVQTQLAIFEYIKQDAIMLVTKSTFPVFMMLNGEGVPQQLLDYTAYLIAQETETAISELNAELAALSEAYNNLSESERQAMSFQSLLRNIDTPSEALPESLVASATTIREKLTTIKQSFDAELKQVDADKLPSGWQQDSFFAEPAAAGEESNLDLSHANQCN